MSMKEVNQDGSLVPVTQRLPGDLFVEFERRDNDAIMAELQGAVIEEFVYSFRSGGKQVVGLSLPGVMAVAQSMGGITCGQPIWTITDEDITCDISATDHKVGLTVWGTATAPLTMSNGNRDTFARAKALSKAQRNAIRKVIPETVATKMLEQFMRGGVPKPRAESWQQRPQVQQRPPASPQVERPAVEVVDEDGVIVEQSTPMQTAEDVNFATDRQIKAIFGIGKEQGWTSEEISDVMMTKFGKASTKELTVSEASALIDLLKNGSPVQPELING